MSKERFVKIERLKKIKLDNEKYHQEHVLSKEILDDIKWLIEQAERVEELEFRNEITENRNYKLEQTFKDYQRVNKNMYDMIGDLKLKNLKIEQQNKRYREAREIIEQVYKDSFIIGACGYENGFTDGLDTALDIIEKALEESK